MTSAQSRTRGRGAGETVKIDDVMEFFARYVSEWNPNKDDAGEEKQDHVAEKVNRDSVLKCQFNG